jgi:hypothetical protein
MVFLPQSDDPSNQVLQFIRERGVVFGWQILSETGLTGQRLLDAARAFMKFLDWYRQGEPPESGIFVALTLPFGLPAWASLTSRFERDSALSNGFLVSPNIDTRYC